MKALNFMDYEGKVTSLPFDKNLLLSDHTCQQIFRRRILQLKHFSQRHRYQEL